MKQTTDNMDAKGDSAVKPDAITVHVDRLKPNPDRVRKEKLMNASGWGFWGAFVGALTPTFSDMFKGHSSTKMQLSVIGAVCAGVVSAAIGYSLKTDEEERSETLLRAAKSGMFEEAIKYDMRKREEKAYRRGINNGDSQVGHTR